jgi:hypothetical protein
MVLVVVLRSLLIAPVHPVGDVLALKIEIWEVPVSELWVQQHSFLEALALEKFPQQVGEET